MRGVWRCALGCGKDVAKTWYYSCTCYMYSYRDVFPLALHVLNGFVNNLTGRQCEVAGDATQEQSTDNRTGIAMGGLGRTGTRSLR